MPSVSIIMAAYNAERYIADAIRSVIAQTHADWELLVVNDGSRDNTAQVVRSFDDARISLHEQVNRGVSAARNVGLAKMKGEYFCFLDADDILPPNSLGARVARFEADPAVNFVDGRVSIRDASMETETGRYQPSARGDVFSDLVRLSERCFFAPTWMIKTEPGRSYRFPEGVTHGEDLCFYLSLAKGRRYDYVDDDILWYRKGHASAMSNIDGLEAGYRHFYAYAAQLGASASDLRYLRLRILRIVFLSHLFDGRSPVKALRSLLWNLR